MKLTQIKNLGYLAEGIVPITITMTLREVINAGEVTNPVQVFIMAQLVQFLKNENPETIRNFDEYRPDAALVASVKNLSKSDSVELATSLINRLSCWCPAVAIELYSPDQNLLDWIKYVLHKQD